MIDCFALLRSDRDTANRPSLLTELVEGRTNRSAPNLDEPRIGLLHLYDRIECSGYR